MEYHGGTVKPRKLALVILKFVGVHGGAKRLRRMRKVPDLSGLNERNDLVVVLAIDMPVAV